MQYHLARVALALSAFKSERGAYPATLGELSPTYLGVVPIDSFVERPLKYSRTNAGYALHSAGPDMKDDGGTGDDLTVSAPASATTRPSS